MERKDHHEEFLAKQRQEAAWSEEFYNKTVQQLNNDPRIQEFLSGYNTSSTEGFIKHYARLKTEWYKHGDDFGEHRRRQDEERTEDAIKVLKQIQLKKLFDITCRWANYELSLPEIEVTMELVNYEHKIFDCPFLPPVEEHEIDAFIDFLCHWPADKTFDSLEFFEFSEHNFLTRKEPRWQTDEEYSPWFRWYDAIYNTGHLKDKPAPKIDKEDIYDDKGREYERAVNPLPPTLELKPYISYHSFKDEYVQRFETEEYREMYAARRAWDKRLEFGEEVESDIILLSDAREPVPVEDNEDWREAIKQATEMYKRRLIIAELPYVFDEYLAKRKDGDSFKDWHDKDNDWMDGLITNEKKRILLGRKVMGEPEDFNY